MAGQVKGITIEIGGNTAPLEQGLKDVNKEIKGTQKDLKEVEKLLKLDPRNTELLAEKQKLLAQAVDQTSTKLDALKQAKTKADEAMKNGTEVNKEEYRKLQKEIILTEGELKKYNEQIDASNQKIDLLGKNATTMNNAMKAAGVGVLGLGAALVKSAFSAAEMADDINTLSSKTGLAVEDIQKFKFAADTIDVSLETLTGSLAKLTKNMASAATKGKGDTYEAFNKLNVAITDTNGELRNNQDVFYDTIAALGKIENETERDAIAMQIFGKSAQELNPLIEGGADDLKRLGDEAEAMGLILSQDALDAANELQDGVDKLKATASAAFSKIGADMTKYLIPVVEKLGDLVKWILDNKEPIVVALAAIAAGILAFNMVTMIQGMITAFQAWRVATEGMTVAQAALNLVMSLNPIGIVISLIAALTAALVVLWNTNEEFREKLISAWEAIKQTAIDVWERIKKFFTEDIPNAFKAVLDFVQTHWQDLLLFIVNPIARSN